MGGRVGIRAFNIFTRIIFAVLICVFIVVVIENIFPFEPVAAALALIILGLLQILYKVIPGDLVGPVQGFTRLEVVVLNEPLCPICHF